MTAGANCPSSGGGVNCLLFTELTGVNTSVPALGSRFFWSSPPNHMYFPALTIDSLGRWLVSFNRSSATEFISLYGTYRLATDSPLTLRAPVLARTGEGAYHLDRWGDYGGTHLDPVNPDNGWIAGMYARQDGTWGTFIGVAPPY
jgi:hypothetical protein